MNIKFIVFCFPLLIMFQLDYAQTSKKYDLNKLLKTGKLEKLEIQTLTGIQDGSKKGITCNGIIWLKSADFTYGTVELDMRGKDIFQKSFIGIAFHGIDMVTYEAVYFRPFNFRAPDSLRIKHAVQYVNEPKQPWDVLREQYPLRYENSVNPIPQGNEWFHAKIVITPSKVEVYVNNSARASLIAPKLGDRKDGLLGLWIIGEPGDFANLVISK